MSGPIRLVVSDIDGTLVRDDKSLSPATIDAAKRLMAAGAGFSLISARPASGMLWIAEAFGLNGLMGAFNGGTLVHADGSVVSAERLAADAAARALDLIDRPNVIVWLFRAGVWHASRLDDHYTKREIAAARQQPTVTADMRGLLDEADKIVAVSEDHDLLARLEGEAAAALGDAATVARSQPYYLDITAPAANKGDGLAALAKASGVPLEAVAVLGDQRNDLPMFARAGLSIAMGQGPEEVRAAATHVTRSNEEDGVAHAIDEILLARVAK